MFKKDNKENVSTYILDLFFVHLFYQERLLSYCQMPFIKARWEKIAEEVSQSEIRSWIYYFKISSQFIFSCVIRRVLSSREKDFYATKIVCA